jgi:hypothetical protein
MLCTRLDLAYPINVVSQHMSKPRTLDCNQAHSSIFARHSQFKLHFRGLPPQEMVGYCDENWVDHLEDKVSTIGFVFVMAGGVFFWSSK